MKSYTLVLTHTVTLVWLFALEIAPNKYLANAFVLVKAWAAFQTTIALVTWLTFRFKLPSPSTINWALTITKDEKKSFLQALVHMFVRGQTILIAAVALIFGQWLIMAFYTLFLCCAYSIRPTAVEYLKGMSIDIENKSAVIDV